MVRRCPGWMTELTVRLLAREQDGEGDVVASGDEAQRVAGRDGVRAGDRGPGDWFVAAPGTSRRCPGTIKLVTLRSLTRSRSAKRTPNTLAIWLSESPFLTTYTSGAPWAATTGIVEANVHSVATAMRRERRATSSLSAPTAPISMVTRVTDRHSVHEQRRRASYVVTQKPGSLLRRRVGQRLADSSFKTVETSSRKRPRPVFRTASRRERSASGHRRDDREFVAGPDRRRLAVAVTHVVGPDEQVDVRSGAAAFVADPSFERRMADRPGRRAPSPPWPDRPSHRRR